MSFTHARAYRTLTKCWISWTEKLLDSQGEFYSKEWTVGKFLCTPGLGLLAIPNTYHIWLEASLLRGILACVKCNTVISQTKQGLIQLRASIQRVPVTGRVIIRQNLCCKCDSLHISPFRISQTSKALPLIIKTFICSPTTQKTHNISAAAIAVSSHEPCSF